MLQVLVLHQYEHLQPLLLVQVPIQLHLQFHPQHQRMEQLVSATNTRVTIVFSEQMQASTVTWQNIAFRDSANNSIDREVGLATDNITCTVIPVAALTAGTYTITVLTGIRFGWKFNGCTNMYFHSQ